MSEQRTLTGESADPERLSSRRHTPATYWLFCPECGEHVARHARHDHDHRLYADGAFGRPAHPQEDSDAEE